MAVASTPSTPQVLLQGASWATYQALSQDLDADPGKRLTDDLGTLEIVVPLPPHE